MLKAPGSCTVKTRPLCLNPIVCGGSTCYPMVFGGLKRDELTFGFTGPGPGVFFCNPFLHLPARDNYCVLQVLGRDFYQTSRSYWRQGKL